MRTSFIKIFNLSFRQSLSRNLKKISACVGVINCCNELIKNCHSGRSEAEIRNLIKYETYYIYILASKKNGVLYTGMTNDLVRRIYEHKNNLLEGFTKKYDVKMLVYHEITIDVNEAILQEKRIKKWKRSWKIKLIEEINPNWRDLYDEII